MALENFRASSLPNPGPTYDPQYVRQLIRSLELYFSQLDSQAPNHAQSYRAQFFYGGLFQGVYIGTTRACNGTVTVADDDYVLIADATSATVTVNLPAAATNAGRALIIKKIDVTANTVVIDGDGSETIDDATTQTLTTQYEVLSIVCDGAEWWIV